MDRMQIKTTYMSTDHENQTITIKVKSWGNRPRKGYPRLKKGEHLTLMTGFSERAMGGGTVFSCRLKRGKTTYSFHGHSPSHESDKIILTLTHTHKG